MATMNRSDLITYIKQAIDLETAVLTQKQIISEYDASTNRRKPVLRLIDIGNKPNEANYDMTKSPFGYVFGSIVTAVFGIALIALAIYLYNMLSDMPTMGAIIAFLIILSGGMLIRVGWQLLSAALQIIKQHKAYTKACIAYKERKKRVTRDNTIINQQYVADKQIWNDSNAEAHAYMNKPLEETETILQMLYSKDIIYSKYRNLPALTSIYEYLITGRCEELTGPHGAYNLYEDEIRKDTVISQLNTVIENLEQIRHNQYMLYEQIKGIQQATRAIAIEMYQIKGYTAMLTELSALNVYYNGINSMNSTALAYCRSL